MASDKRTGPLLRVESSCIGCDHLIPGSRTPPQCLAMTGRMMPTTTPAPAWCPEMGPARLALGRALVAASQPSALDLVPPDEAAIHRRMGSTPIVDADALFGQELRVYPSKEPSR